MTWIPSEKEIADVSAADGRHRFEYFVHRVCETRAVWALYQDGWASVSGDEGEAMIPFWPHRAFAEAFRVGAWQGFEPRRVELGEFLQTWIPGMEKQGVLPAIFPVPTGSSVVVTLEDLDSALRRELEVVYGIEDPE
jgi:hypothetical protein